MTDPVARDALLSSFTHAVRVPYLAMALVVLIAALCVARSDLPDITPPDLVIGDGISIFSNRRLAYGIIAMFVYVGTEVMAGDAIGTYGQGFGLPLDQTKFFTSVTLAAMMIGYMCGLICIPRFVRQERYLAGSCFAAIALTLGAFLSSGYVSVLCVAALGFANSMMMPALFPMAIRGLGNKTPLGSALLVMAFCGGALVPQAFVGLKHVFGFQGVFAALMVPCYLIIVIYAWYCSRHPVEAQA